MLAVGGHVLGDLDEQTVRMATGFAGGIGRTERDICGALSAGVMVLGAMHGRAQAADDEDRCQALVTAYRDRFVGRLGSAYCWELRLERYGSKGREPCSVLVERAAQVFLDLVDPQ